MKKNWRTLIIDDEQLARQRLTRLLEPYDFIDIIGEAVNGQDGLEKTDELLPDLIFLDIEMPVFNGFEMLGRLKHQPKVVFATAWDQYAVKAFEEDSVDYLLKPVETARLEKTIKKLGQMQQQPLDYLSLAALIKQYQLKKDIRTLTVKIGDKILLIKPENIIYTEADDKYVFLHTTDGREHLIDFTISSLEEKLPEQFIRIHRGYIINTDYIKEIRKSFDGAFVFVMNDAGNTKLKSSRSNRELLRERFGI
ncbi:MAG: LytR/AlgR family response regulator transcription factor [Sphingobacteriales bacterium]